MGTPPALVGVAAEVADINNEFDERLTQMGTPNRRRTDEDSANQRELDRWLEEPDAASAVYAEAGAPRLDSFQDGLRAAHEGAPSLNTVIGHSYGSTVIGHAMSDGNSLAVDNVVFVGSPGVGYGVNGVGELSLDNVDPTSNNERIFATAASSDPVTWIGDGVDGIRVAASVFGLPTGELGHGADPTNPSFGATVFDSHPGPSVNIVGVDIGFSPSTHSNYFVEESQSLLGMAQIVAGTR